LKSTQENARARKHGCFVALFQVFIWARLMFFVKNEVLQS